MIETENHRGRRVKVSPSFFAFFVDIGIFMDMKKSELRALIRECVQKFLTEAYLMKKFKDFVSSTIPEAMRDEFITTMYPFFNKTAEKPEEQIAYAKKMLDAAIGKQLSPQDKAYFKNYGIDLDNKNDVRKLTKFHPFISKFLRYVEQTG